MAPGAPQTSPKDVWNKHEQRIENLIKQGYSQLKGENYSAALEAVRTKFFSNYSEKIWFPSLVDHVVKGFIREKRQQLWDAHKALVISNVQEAIPPSAREFQSYYTELLLKLISKQFEASFPESRPAENFVDWFQEFVKQLIDTAIQSGKLGDEELFPDDMKQFVQTKRGKLWDSHRERVVSIVQEALPPAAREFEAHYTNLLVKRVSRQFATKFPESRPNFEEWLKELVKQVIERPVLELTDDRGDLRDEELVRLYRSGFPKCKTLLLERYNAILRQLVPSIVYAKGIHQESEDTIELIKDIAQETSLKLLTEVDSYRFESSFKTWVGTICENEAKTRQRKSEGRSKEGKRKYVTFEDMKHEPEASIPDEHRRVVLRKIIDKHRKQGPRAEKSSNAIEWRYFEGIETAAIAERLQTTVAYVHQLFSHDYPELRRIALDDFGLSGTDL